MGVGGCLFLAVCATLVLKTEADPYDWMERDVFDTVMDKLSSVNGKNCKIKSKAELTLPEGSVSMLPRSNQLLDTSTRVFHNRTCTLALHDQVLSRSYYYSILYKLSNTTTTFWKQPGWEYEYFRQTGFVNGLSWCINRTGLYFDYFKHYPNWIPKIALNNTIELFAPIAFRYDDTRTAFMRENSNIGVRNWDIGVGSWRNYTDKEYNSNHWYSAWLPDKMVDEMLKGSYTVGIKQSDIPGKWKSSVYESHTFFGPPLTRLQDNVNVPVKFTLPYFDCGKRNKWMVSAVAPIVDLLPRYRTDEEIKEFGESKPTFVATASMGTDFLTVDINPCPAGPGNPTPNIFAGIARCKETTMCQPLTGWGFARGGYECVCRPGYRYPAWQKGPFQGAYIELATEEEYKNGFDCIKVGYMKVVPSVYGNRTSSSSGVHEGRRKKRRGREAQPSHDDKNLFIKESLHSYLDHSQDRIMDSKVQNTNLGEKRPLEITAKHTHDFRFKLRDRRIKQVFGTQPDAGKPVSTTEFEAMLNSDGNTVHSRNRRSLVNEGSVGRMSLIFDHIERVRQSKNCAKLPVEDLVLPGDVGYGASKQFKYQAGAALSLAHFLSGMYQNVDDILQTWGVIRGSNLLNPEQLYAEVLSQVMADHKIRGMGIWFDEDAYREPLGTIKRKTRSLFAPYAFQDGDQYKAVDRAGDPDVGSYLKTDWFRKAKMRWINVNGLKKYKLKPKTRVDVNGTLNQAMLYFNTLYCKAPLYSQGLWSPPSFLCDGYIHDWVIKYTTPFFGLNPTTSQPVFKGVVTVDMKMDNLEINQCPAPVWTPNAFKDTARCDYETTYCVPVEGMKMTTGAYRCHCKQGYEYPFIENAWFFAGSFLEAEFEKKVKGRFNRYDFLKCRTAGVATVQVSTSLMVVVWLISTSYWCE